jgi:hypothetical protein
MTSLLSHAGDGIDEATLARARCRCRILMLMTLPNRVGDGNIELCHEGVAELSIMTSLNPT